MEQLRELLAQDDTVLFIGSGISIWSGLPSWSGFVDELARFVERQGADAGLVRVEAARGDLLQAASYAFDRLTKQQIAEFIRGACRYGIAQPHEIHRKIVFLGPRCFVTTNYDDLIERSLRQWCPDRFVRPPITNRHLTETAEIVHARATDFIFKPHGDAGDSESIILTREQYRQLLPGGDRQSALESLKMLLASRPVVYLGFGLRDPDFIYVRDLLANTYKGGVRDHYAILANVSPGETDYWRRNYGIHLVGYVTSERADKTADHSALLTLLHELVHAPPASRVPPGGFTPTSPDVVLALARHAAALTRTPKSNPEFQINVHVERPRPTRDRNAFHQPDPFDHATVERFLDEGPGRALLIGLPGAGKTYSFRRAAARLGERLHEVCLSDPFDAQNAIVPILVDLKLYRGDVTDLVSQTLPTSLALDDLTRAFKVKIFLDSFNEMPREYWASGGYEPDFARFMARVGNSSVVIGSRTSDGLDKLALPTYSLDQIDELAVTTELIRLGIAIEGRFDHEVRKLLQRPFYFQLVRRGVVTLSNDAHPREIYREFFKNVRHAAAACFGRDFDIEHPLSLAAYHALNRGQEAFELSELLRVLKAEIEAGDAVDLNPRDVANWLVSFSVLIPYAGGRVAFVHQSVTEYLAAVELARRYQFDPNVVRDRLTLTRWDQALFLTLSVLPPVSAEAFLKDVLEADFVLGLHAAKYIDVGRDETVARLLSEIRKRVEGSDSAGRDLADALALSLPVTSAHELELRALMRRGDVLGGAAATRLLGLRGAAMKGEVLQLLVDRRADFNLGINIGPALRAVATDDDAAKVAACADAIQAAQGGVDSDDDTAGFRMGAGAFLAGLDLSIIRRALLPSEGAVPAVRAGLLCWVLEQHRSTSALDLAAELLMRGVDEAASAIAFIASFSKSGDTLSWASFTGAHVDRLVSILESPQGHDRWNPLKYLCAERPDLAALVTQMAGTRSGIARAALLLYACPTDMTPVFEALDELTLMTTEQRQEQPIRTLGWSEVDWTGRGELLVRLLKLRDARLTPAILGSSIPIRIRHVGILEIGPIEPWLEYMTEAGSTEEGSWVCEQLGCLFADHLSRETNNRFVTEFNRASSAFRPVLLRFVLPYRNDVTTDVFSEDAIRFLLASLEEKRFAFPVRGHLLGRAATEEFVTERLLPLLATATRPPSRHLHDVLLEAGRRHGRRYVLESTGARSSE